MGLSSIMGLWVAAQGCAATATAPPPTVAASQAQAARQGERAGGSERPTPSSEASTVGLSDPSAELAARVVAASDRTPEDRDRDALRKPVPLLTFVEVAPGLRIADLGAGAGYTTELLARAVGPDGRVFGQNNRYGLERLVKQSWPARLDKPVMSNVVRVDSELDDPLPPQARELDRVTMFFYYHDAVAQGVDVAAMNAAIFEALKPGGLFIVADHHAREGSGTDDTEALHRIDVETVKAQVTAAGFAYVEAGDFLRDPSDTRDWKVYERGFETDRFALKFRKPESL